ncbi:MAG: hypothetical protein K0S38_651 [Candidatus Paceibacter sp.]|jgi:hypothetical protein|nr:hypothetical protein [Candidatus Paceibacter sp.]
MYEPVTGGVIFEWDELILLVGISGQHVRDSAIHSLQARVFGYGVESIAEYLDMQYFPGILQTLARLSLEIARPLLEEVLPLDTEAEQVLNNPYLYFKTEDSDAARRLTTEHFISKVNRGSPEHCKRAMVAFIHFGLIEYKEAIRSAGISHNEKHATTYRNELMNLTDIAQDAIMTSELLVASILASLIQDFRAHV